MTRESKNWLIPITIAVFIAVFVGVGLGLWLLGESQRPSPPREVDESPPAGPVITIDPTAFYAGPPQERYEVPHACEALLAREPDPQQEWEDRVLTAWRSRGDISTRDGGLPGFMPKLEKIRLGAQSPEMAGMLMAVLPAREPDEPSPEDRTLPEGELAAFQDLAEDTSSPSRIPPGRVIPRGESSESFGELRQDIERLQAQVENLQESLETYMGSLVSRLESENARLRQEIQQLHAQRQASEGASPSGVPQPTQQDWLDEMIEAQTGEYPSRPPNWLAEAAPGLMDNPAFRDALEAYSGTDSAPPALEQESAGQGAAELDPTGDADIQTHGSLAYTVTREWGRDPEPEDGSEPGAASLHGMIGAVGPNASDEELLEFAADLRERYDEYDNINIEFFRGARAAQEFAESSVAPPESRVLSVSKHAGTGRDVILLIRGDDVEEYEWPADFGG